MDEKELSEVPDFDDASIDEDDFFDDVDDEVIESTENESTESEDKSESTPTETESDEKGKKVDYSPFLKAISEKAKFNHEPINVDNFDDVVTNFQKGLNYDKVAEKLSNLENSKVFSYVSKKAQEMGITVDEYMESVEKYEQEQQKAQEQQKIDEMISNGVPEEVAREVVATAQLRKQLQQRENELKEQEKAKEQKENKEKEYQEFLETFPDVKAEDIPKEVFVNAQKSNLKTAYLEWQNAELKKQVEIAKTNEKNRSTTTGSTTEFGGVEHEKTDPFLDGFNSV